MQPPSGVYLAALVRRLLTTWARRVGSAASQTGSSGRASFRACPDASMTGRLASTAVSATARSDTRSFRRVSLSLVMRDTSSRSSMSRTMWESWRSIIFRVSMATAGSCDMLSTWRPVRMGASGFRSSWASVARNSSFRRSAFFKASSARFRSVTSWVSPRTNSASPDGAELGHQAGGVTAAPRPGPGSRTR